MINQQLTDWANEQLRQGRTRDEIRQMLKNEGWQDHDIDQVLSADQSHGSQIPTPPAHRETKLIGSWALIKKTLSVFKTNWKTLLGIYILPTLVPVIILIGIFQLIEPINNGVIGVSIVIITLLLVITFIINFTGWLAAALLYAVKNRNERPGIKESYRRTKSLRFLMLGVAIVTSFIVMGGTMLFIIPGIIFGISFTFAKCVLVYENIKGMDALMKSREYVRGMWWRIFGRFLLFGILMIVIVYGVPGILSIFSPTVGNITRSIFWILSAPIIYIFTAILYENLRDIKGINVPVTGKKGRFIVCAILGVIIIPIMLVAFVSLGLGKSTGVARDAIRAADLNLLKSEAELYYIDHGRYPETLDKLTAYGQDYGQNSIPVDPATKEPYRYTVTQTGDDYKLCATMEAKAESCVTGAGSSF